MQATTNDAWHVVRFPKFYLARPVIRCVMYLCLRNLILAKVYYSKQRE